MAMVKTGAHRSQDENEKGISPQAPKAHKADA